MIAAFQKQDIKEAFELFDPGNTGSIDFHKLKLCIRALGIDFRKQEVLNKLGEYDLQASDKIPFPVFLDIAA